MDANKVDKTKLADESLLVPIAIIAIVGFILLVVLLLYFRNRP